MEIGTKLKFCVGLSVIALIIKIIVFASPGWVVVKTDIREPISTGRVEIPENSWKRRKDVSISFGMWYYKVCMCGKGDDDDDSTEMDSGEGDDEDDRHHHKRHGHHKCYHRCYRKKRHGQRIDYVGEDIDEARKEDRDFENDIPPEFAKASDFISTSVEIARHGRHELAAYVTIGLVLGVIGMIAAIVYARGRGVGKHSGRLACSTQVLSSFFYWLAIVRVATYIIQLRIVRDHEILEDHVGKDVWFTVPWCLVLGAIGAIIMDISALFHLILISRDRKSAGAEYVYNTEKLGKCHVPVIAPKGYEELVVPPLYQTEEAGPLPEKQAIS